MKISSGYLTGRVIFSLAQQKLVLFNFGMLRSLSLSTLSKLVTEVFII